MRTRFYIAVAISAFIIASAISVSTVWAWNKGGQNQTVTNSVLERLGDHKLLRHNDVDVYTEGRDVVLTGTVSNIRERNEIESQAAKGAKGYNIVDRLQIKPSSLTDSQLRARVLDKLNNNVFYSVFDWIGIDVNDGVVTLAGWVVEPWHKKQFDSQIQRVPGVVRIDNQIKIESGSIFDDEIRDQAARAIYSDFNFEPYASGVGAPIHIIVNDGVVQLKGVVARTYMRNWAVNTVNTNTKAFRVYDDLQVEWP